VQRLSRKLNLAALIITLTSIAPCAATHKSLEKEIDSFYSRRQILEEKSEGANKITKIYYIFNNKIEVEVIRDSKRVQIKVLKDPDNLIIRNTPKIDSAEDTIYEIDEVGNKHLKFKFNKLWVYTTFVKEGAETVICYKSGTTEGTLPQSFLPIAMEKLKDIEEVLNIRNLLVY